MRTLICILALVLAVLHHDFWWWSDATLVFGFMPIGLAYHAFYSLLAGCLWALAVKYAWPSEADATHEASGREEQGDPAP